MEGICEWRIDLPGSRSSGSGRSPTRWFGSSGEALPAVRAWGASRVSGEVSRADIEDWGELATVAEAQVAWRAVARRAQGKVRWTRAWAGLWACGGARSKPWGCFISAVRARARGLASLGAGARCLVPWACSSASARVKHVDVRFCSCSNAYRAQIFANLGKIVM
jgi:hypothetical protein